MHVKLSTEKYYPSPMHNFQIGMTIAPNPTVTCKIHLWVYTGTCGFAT